MAAHCVSQHYKDQKIIEELEKQKQSKNVYNCESPIDDEEATEEEIDQTIKFTISSINAETQQTTKKRLRKSHTMDPSSLTKRVNKREDRKGKNMDNFQVYGKKKNKEKPIDKEKPAEKAAPELQYMGVETTKLAHLVSENDKIFLNHVFEFEKDIRIPIWENNLSDCTISLQEAIEILNEEDVQNTLIDSFTFMLEREQGDESQILFFKSSLWKPRDMVISTRICVDCGIIVCYIIDKLAHGDRIPESLTTNEIRQYRVLLLQRFLHNEPRTWTETIWKDRKLASEMRFED
ncbi:hypothetical protein RHMOL_Rhmol02G0289100 [Rhododendron molle]|uniref:Uncharacterized protein n=1 Tax=Rhododendron molle TaxID=49168 RepID=A0ACC0PVT8_RHOML|nr:hypothetical protein RHMOL_Rhmol02G0289100 [Rhododendron molle]